MSIIQVLRSVNKSLNNQTPKCEYLQKWLYHISTYSKVALTSTKLLVKLTHRLGFLGRRAFGRMFGSFEYFIMYWNDHGCLANIHILYEWFFVLYACYFILHRTRPRHGFTFNGACAYSKDHLIMKIKLSHEEEILITNMQSISCQWYTHITIQHPPIHYYKLKSSTRTQIKATN